VKIKSVGGSREVPVLNSNGLFESATGNGEIDSSARNRLICLEELINDLLHSRDWLELD